MFRASGLAWDKGELIPAHGLPPHGQVLKYHAGGEYAGKWTLYYKVGDEPSWESVETDTGLMEGDGAWLIDWWGGDGPWNVTTSFLGPERSAKAVPAHGRMQDAAHIHFRQCGHRCGGGRAMNSSMARRTAGKDLAEAGAKA